MGIAKLLSQMPEGAPNIRLHEGDARDIIEALPDASLGRVFILFPDPWPKTRHHKRRFLQMEMLDALARVTETGRGTALCHRRQPAISPGRWNDCWRIPPSTGSPRAPQTGSRARRLAPDPLRSQGAHGPPAFLRFVRKAKL